MGVPYSDSPTWPVPSAVMAGNSAARCGPISALTSNGPCQVWPWSVEEARYTPVTPLTVLVQATYRLPTASTALTVNDRSGLEPELGIVVWENVRPPSPEA